MCIEEMNTLASVQTTNLLILMNTILYFTANASKWAFVPKTFWANMNSEAPKLLTSTFMHANLSHLMFNMVSLYLFGHLVEKYMGSTTFFVFYIAAGILNTYIYALWNPKSSVMTLGASGAIASVVAIYFLIQQRTGSFMNVIYFELIGLMFGQLSGINYMAHLIGLGIGAIYYYTL
jgi:membrane associated rhomboid family serine protease